MRVVCPQLVSLCVAAGSDFIVLPHCYLSMRIFNFLTSFSISCWKEMRGGSDMVQSIEGIRVTPLSQLGLQRRSAQDDIMMGERDAVVNGDFGGESQSHSV